MRSERQHKRQNPNLTNPGSNSERSLCYSQYLAQCGGHRCERPRRQRNNSLYAAIQTKHSEIVIFLLGHNDIDVDIDLDKEQHAYALHLAVSAEVSNLVIKLLATGKVDVSAEHRGVPSLLLATKIGSVQTIFCLTLKISMSMPRMWTERHHFMQLSQGGIPSSWRDC